MEKSLEKNSIVLFGLTLGSNGLNYVFQVVTANMLPHIADYGILNALMSFFCIIAIPYNLMVLITAHYSAIELSKGNADKLKTILGQLVKICNIVAICILLIGFFSSKLISIILQIDNSIYVLMTFILTSVYMMGAVFVGFLQGKQLFWQYGIQNLLNCGVKLGISIALLYLGFSVGGVLLAMIIAIVVVIVYSSKYSKGVVKLLGNEKIVLEEGILKYILASFVLQTALNVLMNGDILLVKIFFEEDITGLYSSASVIVKTASYVSGAVVAVFFPMVAEKKEKKENVRGILYRSLLYGGGAAVVIVLFINIFGDVVVKILFGTRYLESAQLLSVISFLIIPITLLSVTLNFIMALGKSHSMIKVIMGCFVLIAIYAYLFHNSIAQMLCGIGVILWFVVIINFIKIIKQL